METQKFNLWKSTWYETPEIPPIKTIRGYKLPIDQQVWTRHTEYLKWRWNDDPKKGAMWWDNPEDGQLEWYYAEINRILNGEWVMVEGKPVYLNLFAYFYFQWFYTKEGNLPKFKDTCVLFMYFMEHVFFKDKRCRGGNTMKGRRKHVSTMCMSIMLQFGLIKQNIEEGITSMAAKDAEKIFQLMLVNGYSRLPNFLKPRISGTDDPKTSLHITKQAGKITKDQNTGAEKGGLNNRIEWRAPKSNVFDGDGLWFLLLDEAGKWPNEIPIDEYLEIASNIITAGEEMGRIIIITTVNRGDKGGARYKIVWDGSNQDNIDVLGQTKNKLLQYFIPGYMGGRDLGWVDKYGNSVWDTPTPEQTEWLKNDPYTLDPYMGCKDYCELQRKLKANDPEKLQEEIRMFPFTPKEVFDSANNQCHFNTTDLNNQKERILTKLESNNPYRIGLFKKDDPNGRVEFKDCKMDDPKGFYWYGLELLDYDTSNKWVWQHGQKTPNNTDYGAGGVDTFSNSEATAEKGSDAAIVIHKRYNALEPDESGMPVCFGIGRPKNKLFFHQQLFWALEYYGVKALVERSPTDWYDYAKDNKLLGYLIKTNLKLNGQEVYGISPQDKEGREQHLTEMVEWADNNIEKLWFLRIIEDMFEFNVDERTLYDGCMAFGYALMGCKDKYRRPVVPVNEAQIVRIYDLRAKYGKASSYGR